MNYDFDNLVDGTLTVNKAVLTVTADPRSKRYGDPVPNFTYTVTGFVNNDNSSVVRGNAVVTSLATTGSPVGTYTISLSQGSLAATNYAFTNLVAGTLTVSPADLTVTAASDSTLYGESVPALIAIITGYVNGDDSSVVSGQPFLSTAAGAGSPVGAYAIIVSQGSLLAANYDFLNLVPGGSDGQAGPPDRHGDFRVDALRTGHADSRRPHRGICQRRQFQRGERQPCSRHHGFRS